MLSEAVYLNYFKILYLPITGTSFALPLAALMIPIIASTRNTTETRSKIVPTKPSLYEIAVKIESMIVEAMLYAKLAIKITKP